MTTESRELAIFAINDQTCYKHAQECIKNLKKKIVKGTYDADKALILWQYNAENAAKAYAKEFGGTWHKLFSVTDRKEAAKEIAEHYESELFDE
jgi:hypothetical protein